MRARAILLLLALCVASLAAVSGSFVRRAHEPAAAVPAGDITVVPVPPVVDGSAVPAGPPQLSHPDVRYIPLQRKGGVSRKALFRARAGDKHYQKLMAANMHGAQINALKHERELLAARRHAALMATDGSTAPAPTVSEMAGCPFADFTAPVRVGSGTFDLLVDTGSSTLALAGSACTTCADGGVSPMWAESSSSINQNRQASGTYGDQSGWVGQIWQDNVHIVDGSGQPVTSEASMRIVVITEQSVPGFSATGAPNKEAGYFFTADACNDSPTQGKAVTLQGIIGLGFQRLASSGTDSFPAKLWEQRDTGSTIPQMFAIQMCEYSGALWFGGYDASSFTGAIVWTPILAQSGDRALATYYSVDPADVFIGTKSLGFTGDDWPRLHGAFNIIDSGTTLWELPTKIFNAVRDTLLADANFKTYFRSDPSGDNFFDKPLDRCEYALDSQGQRLSGKTLQQNLPTISIRFANGATLTMDLVGSVLLPCSLDYDQWTLGIAPSSDNGLLGGWPLMNQFITIHDVDTMQLGFAVQSSCTTSLAPLHAKVAMGDSVPGTDDDSGDGSTADGNGGGDGGGTGGLGGTGAAAMQGPAWMATLGAAAILAAGL